MLSTDIRDAANQFESRFDKLSNSYLDKDFNIFWRLWKNKVHKKPHISHVAGDSDDACIAGAFAAHFSDSDCTTPNHVCCVMFFLALILSMVININGF